MDDRDLAAVHELELRLLDEFSRVCAENDIPFVLAYGSCLGAVRHHGFIPWDDDLDVFVSARDLTRLREVMATQLGEGFFYQTPETDPQYNLTIDRLRLDGTTAIEADMLDRDVHQGVWLDIQPLTDAAPGKLERWWQKCWAMVNTLLTVHRPPLHHGAFGRVAYAAGMLLLDHGWARRYAKRTINKYVGQDTGVVCTFVSAWFMIKRDYPQEMFVPTMMPFEGRDVPVPGDYDGYLTISYGDYLRIPPPEERHGCHSIVFFDPDTSYEAYRGVKYLTQLEES